MTSEQIRQTFINFFQEKEHQIVASAPIVIKNDPTLMFTNAGMNQFKDIFLGDAPAKYARIADSQKCLRVSGKHNDLEEVGHDGYHHTMFEMLGNWSFGNYFKKEAIDWAWELLTEVYKLPKDRLYATVFEGDKGDGTSKDTDAHALWMQYLPKERILNGNKKDNFWEMGDTGPCGPCSEIHIDLRSDADRKKVDGATLVNNDHHEVIEIWNLVFMEFNRKADSSLHPLPQKHVDTGMGFERLCMALQGKLSSYDTDVFQPLIQFISKKAKIAYGKDEKTDIAMRVMADHIRAVAFAIADGQLPSNNKAGYVIRRILRRAVRYSYSYLNIKEPILFELFDILRAQMEKAFPELQQQASFISKVIQEEESSFLRTLSAGIDRFNDYSKNLKGKVIAGDFAFELYDTFGFPIDLTQLMAHENGLEVDLKGFEKGLHEQKSRSRKAADVQKSDWTEVYTSKDIEFVGYDQLLSKTKIIRYRSVSESEEDYFELVLSPTPFYPEGGGQVGDVGYIESQGNKIEIQGTRKENQLIIHKTPTLPSDLNSSFMASVNAEKRRKTECNHSVTHLLHAALKSVLGTHVAQKGSLVNADHLRFDFSHFSAMSNEEIQKVEKMVNEKIQEGIPLDEKRSVPFQMATEKLGATALFGEKYGEEVRVITFNPKYSVELCGGTHVSNTSIISLFVIKQESSVAAGVRRIEALTGMKAYEFLQEKAETLEKIKKILPASNDPMKSIQSLQDELKSLRKAAEEFGKLKAQESKAGLLESIQSEKDFKYLILESDIEDPSAVKDLAFELKDQYPDLILVIAHKNQDKPMLTVMVADALIESKKWNAGTLVRELAKEIQGGGGGQAFFATAGGKDLSGISAALKKAKDIILS